MIGELKSNRVVEITVVAIDTFSRDTAIAICMQPNATDHKLAAGLMLYYYIYLAVCVRV